ncbi:hypothetical protein LWI29_029872 [Acer saccharum]|uniref:AAA ATPase AAA+ lid domain-containing protein n=1 Tax=Acer saccharum TaxID=4024 RepID=A0AA39S3I3_ACESA|nr:hypothetical protein LWI29_029872 [Acer saccharum]
MRHLVLRYSKHVCESRLSHGFSGADITEICQGACKYAIRENIEQRHHNQTAETAAEPIAETAAETAPVSAAAILPSAARATAAQLIITTVAILLAVAVMAASVISIIAQIVAALAIAAQSAGAEGARVLAEGFLNAAGAAFPPPAHRR